MPAGSSEALQLFVKLEPENKLHHFFISEYQFFAHCCCWTYSLPPFLCFSFFIFPNEKGTFDVRQSEFIFATVPVFLSTAWLIQLQSFQVENIRQDYETGKDDIAMISFKVDFDQVEKLEDAIKANCSRELVFYKR